MRAFTGASTVCSQIRRGLREPMHSAHPVSAAVFVYMSVAGWNPLCSSCHAAAAVQSSPDKQIIKTDSAAWGKKGGEKGDVCLQYLSFSYARMDFCFDFHLALISPPTPPHPDCVLLFLHAGEPAIWKGFGASPHNSLSDRHPPALSRHCSQTLPTSDSAVAEASNQQWHFSPLDVCSSISLWRMKVKLWPLEALVYTWFWPDALVISTAPRVLFPNFWKYCR